MTKRSCKDCDGGARPAPHPGPRCVTHHRARKKALREAAHGRWILKTYGITSGQYEALYEAQGGSCYICCRAKGVTKKLSVDHDHLTGWVRGLLCSLPRATSSLDICETAPTRGSVSVTT